MLHLKAFGGLSVAVDGSPGSGAAQQRKTLALLALVAASGQRGIGRDKLIAYLWPEADTEHARGLLKQARYALRRDLHAPDLFLGATELRLNPTVISSDIQAFEAALDRGDPAQAAPIYTGPFLDGFYLSDATEFEHWVEAERGRLRQRACEALETIATEAASRGNYGCAVEWGRRLAALDPLNSRVALSLMNALAATGDRAGALHVARVHERLLRDEVDAAPDPAVVRLVERLRADSDGRAAAPRAVSGPAAPRPSSVPHAPSPGERRHVRAIVRAWRWAAAALVVGTVGVALDIRGPRPAPSPLSPYRIAVLPFTYQGDSAHAYLGDGMARLLTANLDGAGPYTTVATTTVSAFLAANRLAPADPARAPAVGRRFDARLYVVGSVVEAGGRLRVTAELFDAAEGRDAAARSTAEGGTDEIFRLVDRVSAGLLAQRLDGPTAHRLRLAASTTESVAALKEYLRGEAAVREGRFETAVGLYRRAVELDSTFALARYRLAVLTAIWEFVPPWNLPEQEAEAALRHAARLPTRERMLLEAFAAHARGEVRAFRLYRDIVSRYPNDLDGLLRLGQLLLDYGSVIGRSVSEARQPLERALALDPGNVEARECLFEVAMSEHDYQGAWAFARGAGGDDAQWFTPVPDIIRRLLGPPSERERAIVELAKAPVAVTRWVALFFPWSEADPELIERVTRLVVERPDVAVQNIASWILADVAVLRGRWTEAEREFERLDGPYPDRAYLVRGLYLGAGAYPADARALEAHRRALARWKAPPPDTLADPRRQPEAQVRWHLKVYVVGLLDVRLRNLDAALRAADELERLGGWRPARALGGRLAAELRARVMRARGDPAGALAVLERADAKPGHPAFRWVSYSPLLDLSGWRWLRAELTAELGRDREALGWYQAFLESEANSTAFFIPAAHLRVAELHHRLGEEGEAVRHARRLIEMWSAPDSAWLPLRAKAVNLAEAAARAQVANRR
jgi:DNA-binding SARP family transcriptional activator/TolB-like protein